MTEITKEVGIMILNYAYEACDANEVPHSEIGDLLLKLGESVIIGQPVPEPKAVEPPKSETHRVTHSEHARMFELRSQGWSYDRISHVLQIPKSTVRNHLSGLNQVVKASLPEPLSDPASDL